MMQHVVRCNIALSLLDDHWSLPRGDHFDSESNSNYCVDSCMELEELHARKALICHRRTRRHLHPVLLMCDLAWLITRSACASTFKHTVNLLYAYASTRQSNVNVAWVSSTTVYVSRLACGYPPAPAAGACVLKGGRTPPCGAG